MGIEFLWFDQKEKPKLDFKETKHMATWNAPKVYKSLFRIVLAQLICMHSIGENISNKQTKWRHTLIILVDLNGISESDKNSIHL